jgi:hypothetical protein
MLTYCPYCARARGANSDRCGYEYLGQVLFFGVSAAQRAVLFWLVNIHGFHFGVPAVVQLFSFSGSVLGLMQAAARRKF